MLLLKNLTKTLGKKRVIMFVLIRYIILQILFSLDVLSLVIRENSQAMLGCRKIVFIKSHLCFYKVPYLYSFKLISRVRIFGNSFQILEICKLCMAGHFRLGKHLCWDLFFNKDKKSLIQVFSVKTPL